MGFPQPDYHPRWVLEEVSQIVPFFAGVKWDKLGEQGKQWPVKPDGTQEQRYCIPKTSKRGKGKFHFEPWRESEEINANGKTIRTSSPPTANWNITMPVR